MPSRSSANQSRSRSRKVTAAVVLDTTQCSADKFVRDIEKCRDSLLVERDRVKDHFAQEIRALKLAETAFFEERCKLFSPTQLSMAMPEFEKMLLDDKENVEKSMNATKPVVPAPEPRKPPRHSRVLARVKIPKKLSIVGNKHITPIPKFKWNSGAAAGFRRFRVSLGMNSTAPVPKSEVKEPRFPKPKEVFYSATGSPLIVKPSGLRTKKRLTKGGKLIPVPAAVSKFAALDFDDGNV